MLSTIFLSYKIIDNTKFQLCIEIGVVDHVIIYLGKTWPYQGHNSFDYKVCTVSVMCIFKEFNCDRLFKWINSKFSVEYFVAMLPSWMDLAMDNEWLPDQEVVWNKVPLEWPQRSKLNYPHPDWRNCWSTLWVELGEHLKRKE